MRFRKHHHRPKKHKVDYSLCPRCGDKLQRQSNIWRCPSCGCTPNLFTIPDKHKSMFGQKLPVRRNEIEERPLALDRHPSGSRSAPLTGKQR